MEKYNMGSGMGRRLWEIFLLHDFLSRFSKFWNFDFYGKIRLHLLQVNNYEIVVKIFHISHILTWYSEIVYKFARISKVCSTYELTKQFMEISVKNLKKNNLY